MIRKPKNNGWLLMALAWALLLAPAAAMAQAESAPSTWMRYFKGSSAGVATSIENTVDGGFILLGHTDAAGAGGTDVIVTKLDGNGERVWQKSYGGNLNEWGDSIQQTAEGGYIFAGESYSSGGQTNRSDLWVVKLTELGEITWQRGYRLDELNKAWSIYQTPDGGYVVGGTVYHCCTYYSGWILKLDAAGNVVWQKQYKPNNWGNLLSLRPTSDGGFIGIGNCDWYDNIWVIKLDALGRAIWSRYVNDPWKAHSGMFIREVEDGGFVLLGKSDSVGIGGWDAWMIRLDAQGSILWQKAYGGGSDENVWYSVPSNDGGFIVLGSTKSFGLGAEDTWLFKVDSNGDLVWQRVFNTLSSNWPRWAVYSADGALVIAGKAGIDQSDLYVAKINIGGEEPAFCEPFLNASAMQVETSASIVAINTSVSTPSPTMHSTSFTAANQELLSSTVCASPVCTITCSATAPESVYSGRFAYFTATATTADCTGPVTYDWDFGDGSPHSAEEDPSHAYTAPGNYTWAATAIANGVPCSATGVITVSNLPPCILSCSASAPAKGTTDLAVTLLGLASIPDLGCSGAIAYDWSFGDGTAHSSSQNPAHLFATPGTYTWTLTTGVDGLTCTQSGSISISNPPPCVLACRVAAPTFWIQGVPASFGAAAADTPDRCTGNPTYSWEFGDGTSSTQQNPTHTYATAGTYYWVMTASVQGVTCTQTGSVDVSAGNLPGDCNMDGRVTIGEVQKVINVFLGVSSGC